MQISGHIPNGVVVLDESTSLPEGTPVTVTVRTEPAIHFAKNRTRVQFPLVESDRPGSVHLTNERIAEILEDEGIEAMIHTWNAPS